MYAYRETLSIAGVGGLLAGLDQCADEDFELAIREISQIVPEVVSRTPARAWKVAMHKIAITLSADREYVDLVLLTNELFLHEALAAIEHRGLTQVLAPARVTPKQAANIERNVPEKISVEVVPPGLVPIIPTRTAVLAIAFEAGGGYLLVEGGAARALGAIRGQQFTGEIIALLPLHYVSVHERLADWQMVQRDQFSGLCRPDGFESISPKI